jgi:sugar lactone lactonase YvrE
LRLAHPDRAVVLRENDVMSRRSTGYILACAFAFVSVLLAFQLKPRSVTAQQVSTPTMRHVAPDTITAGGRPFTVLLVGSGFQDGAQVLFDGAPLSNPRVSTRGRELLAEVAASQVASVGTHSIQGVNPDGGATRALTLTVVQQDPDLNIRLTGSSAEENVQADLQGTMFAPSGTFDATSVAVVWGFDSPTTTLVNDTELTFTITQDLLRDVARIPIMVRNKGGRLSNYEIFFVVPRPAKITGIDPDTVDAGSADFTLDVVGTDFKSDATIVVNGQALPTKFVKPGKIEATVPGALAATPGELVVRVQQTGIQSGDVTLDVTATMGPFIFSVAPRRLRQGETRDALLVVGSNFSGDLVAMIDGQMHGIRTATHRALTLAITSDLLATVGTHTLQVVDKNGTSSNTVTFQVVPDVTVAILAGQRREGFNNGCAEGGQAQFRGPRRLARGPDGLIYVTDQLNHAVRSVNPATAEVCTIAGTGLPGYIDSNNTRGWAPAFSTPNGLAVAADGTIYVTDNGNGVMRRITRGAGGAVTVDTFAGTTLPISDKSRQDRLNSTEVGISGFRDGPALDSFFEQPDDIAIAADGTIYVSDPINSAIRRIRQVSGQTVMDTLAGSGVPGFIDGINANARFNTPLGIALSQDGRFLLVADFGNDRIRRVNLVTGIVDTLAGNGNAGFDDGPPADATFDGPIGIAVDSDGAAFVSELNNGTIRRVETSGDVSTLAGGGRPRLIDGPGVMARFSSPKGLAIDRVARVLYVADFENNSIRSITLR